MSSPCTRLGDVGGGDVRREEVLGHVLLLRRQSLDDGHGDLLHDDLLDLSLRRRRSGGDCRDGGGGGGNCRLPLELRAAVGVVLRRRRRRAAVAGVVTAARDGAGRRRRRRAGLRDPRGGACGAGRRRRVARRG